MAFSLAPLGGLRGGASGDGRDEACCGDFAHEKIPPEKPDGTFLVDLVFFRGRLSMGLSCLMTGTARLKKPM